MFRHLVAEARLVLEGGGSRRRKPDRQVRGVVGGPMPDDMSPKEFKLRKARARSVRAATPGDSLSARRREAAKRKVHPSRLDPGF